MKVCVALALAAVLVCSSAAWADDYIELHRWDFDTTGDAQNWDRTWGGGWAGDYYGEQADTYDGTNFVNLDGQYPDWDPIDNGALWPPTIDPATEGGALRLNCRGDWGYYEASLFQGNLEEDDEVMKIQFNSTTYNSIEHSQVWLDWYLRSPDGLSVSRVRTYNLAVRGDVQDGEWWRTTYTVDDIDGADIVVGSKWWAPGELGNLNRVEAVNFVMNIHYPEMGPGPYTPYFLDDIRLIGTPEPASLVLLMAGAGIGLLRRRRA